MGKSIFLLFYIISLFLAFITNVFSQGVPKIRVNPEQAFGGNMSEYFTNIEYIPLETTKISLFGNINRLIVTDSSFVVYDDDTHTILFFDLSGKYITKVKGKKESLGENISYNRDLGYIELSRTIISTQEREVKYYTKLGTFISVNSVAFLKNIQGGMLSLGGDYYALSKGCYIPDLDLIKNDTINRIEIYKNNMLFKSFLPITQQENQFICAVHGGYIVLPNSVDSGSFYISTPLEHMVYQVNKDNAQAVFQFVFPTNRVISTEILNSKDKKNIRSNQDTYLLNPDPLKIMTVSNIFFKNELLFFKINPQIYHSGGGTDIKYQYNFIYNTVSNKLVSLERLSPDASTAYLPVFNERVRIDGLMKAGEDYYSNISSFNMFAAHQANKNKNPNYPLVLQEYFKTQNRKSNPVIVRMKLKD